MRTCTVARVERVDAATGVVDVLPLIRAAHEDANGARVVEREAVISNVPLMQLGTSALRIAVPVVVGDEVLVVFSDRSLDKWKEYGGEVDPVYDHRFQRSDAIAIPVNFRDSDPQAGVIVLGATSGTLDPVALNSKVLAALSDIASKFNMHTHLSAAPTFPTGTPTVSTPPVSMSAPGSVGSATVKVRE
jgi:hypothetical protein